MMLGAEHLARNFAKVPTWIVCMARKVYPPHAPQDSFMHSTIYPAAQNMIVAARCLGIGACFTTFPGQAEPGIRALCNVPADLHMFVYVAVGLPERRFMTVQRKPVAEVMTWNSSKPPDIGNRANRGSPGAMDIGGVAVPNRVARIACSPRFPVQAIAEANALGRTI